MQAGQDHAQPVVFYRSTPPTIRVPPMLEDAAVAGGKAKKQFVRRRGDRSQQIRFWVQVGFGALTLVSGIQFYLWVRYHETAARACRSRVPRASKRGCRSRR
jgi:hypothetical protein